MWLGCFDSKLSLRYYSSLERPFPYENRNKLLKEFSLYTTACLHPWLSNLLYSEAIIWEFCFYEHKKALKLHYTAFLVGLYTPNSHFSKHLWNVRVLTIHLQPHSPEFSSFTKEDMVLVIESAATSKSFLKFRLAPEARDRQNSVSNLHKTYVFLFKAVLTLLKAAIVMIQGIKVFTRDTCGRVLCRMSSFTYALCKSRSLPSCFI